MPVEQEERRERGARVQQGDMRARMQRAETKEIREERTCSRGGRGQLAAGTHSSNPRGGILLCTELTSRFALLCSAVLRQLSRPTRSQVRARPEEVFGDSHAGRDAIGHPTGDVRRTAHSGGHGGRKSLHVGRRVRTPRGAHTAQAIKVVELLLT